ncbi:MAG: hypothetical protein IH628_00230 [Proteobacteria bacterium]|nr:hypothetical protein [Pseudomonadota bacterium]
MDQSISTMVTGAIIAGGVAGLVSIGGAIATVSFLRQSFSEFKAETASEFRELWKKKESKMRGLIRLNESMKGWRGSILYSPVNIRCIMGQDDRKMIFSLLSPRLR